MNNPTEKKLKKKGPIRFEAVIPVVVLLTLMALYFKLFFDSHLKNALEWSAEQVHGAEVNINSLHTSFLKGSFLLQKLEVTDKKNPSHNLVQIGEIRFQFLWDALLRAKFVVEDAGVEQIEANAPRKKPGKVFPEKPVDQSKNEQLEKVKGAALDQTQEQLGENILGDVANVMAGTNPEDQLKNIQGELKAEKRLKEAKAELEGKEDEWKEKIKQLPTSEEMKELQAKAKQIDFKNPLVGIKAANDLMKESKDKIKKFKTLSKELKEDVNKYKNVFKEVEALAKEDVKSLQEKFKVPELNVGDFSKGLFQRLFNEKIQTIEKYAEQGRRFMPPKKTDKNAGKEVLTPRERAKGKNYTYPILGKSYPLFWLKNASVSSQSNASEYSGDLKGAIQNFATSPELVEKPATIEVAGDFPKQKIMGFESLLTIDHRTPEAKENILLKIGQYPVPGKMFSNSDDVKLGLNQASGEITVRGALQDSTLQITIDNFFRQIDYVVDAKNKHVKEILSNVVQDIPVVTVNARATGSLKQLNWNIRSNLGEELGNGFKKQVQVKIDEAKAKITKLVDEKIKGPLAEYQNKFDQAKDKLENVIDGEEKKIDSAEKDLAGQLSKGSKANSPEQKINDKAEEKTKKLLKKFKF
jgi:uncharacterized protein (TIGR03545 family)